MSALGLVVNIIVLWNTLYMDAGLDQLRSEGYEVRPEDEARLSPFGHEHINMGLYQRLCHQPQSSGGQEMQATSSANFRESNTN